MKKTLYLSLLITTFILNLEAFGQAKITHIAVFTQDIKKSTEFYTRVFQFTLLDEPFKDGLHTWLDIGNSLALHIIQAEGEPVTINKHNHLCFSVTDMDAFIGKITALNIPFEDWAGIKNKITVRPDGVKQIYIRDPDGYWLEVNDEK